MKKQPKYTKERMQIGDNLIKYRKQNNKTQEDIAKILKMTRQAYSKIERGESNLTYDKANTLADYYKIPVSLLIKNDTAVDVVLFDEIDIYKEKDEYPGLGVASYVKRYYFERQKIKTKDGKPFSKIGDEYYRLYEYIDNTVWYEEITDLKLIYKAAQAFGQFHKALKGFDANELKETIPNFHNTYQRYLNFLEATKTDKLNRVKTCLPEIQIVRSFESDYRTVVDLIADGTIPLAVTHNDPKINNVLFDKDSGEIRVVIDLDTIMPGSYLYDFGDALRSLFTGDNEDSEDLSKLKVKFDVFETYTKGYLSEMENVLTQKEIELLPFSAFILTIECGIRFLEDYIRGDVYFRIKKPNHNLFRARTQIAIANDIFNNLDRLNDIIDKLMLSGHYSYE